MAEHPLKRIMAREDAADGQLITTAAHLARDLGEAVHHGYQGRLDYHYVEDDPALRMHWRRDA